MQPEEQQPSDAQGPAQYPSYPAAAVVTQCRMCGSVPAAPVTFRGHRGMIVIMQFRHVDGPFCRDCGLALFRKFTADTLLLGWWGVFSVFITPITVLINLARRGSVANLAPPGPAPHGFSQPALDPGKPLLARPTAVIGLLLPVALYLLLLLAH